MRGIERERERGGGEREGKGRGKGGGERTHLFDTIKSLYNIYKIKK